MLALAGALGLCGTAAAQPISATTLDGGHVSLIEARGHVVIVHFWATWCAPCRIETPALDAYYRAHHVEGLDMVAIALDADGNRRKLTKATAAFQFPIARIADTRIARSDIPTALPETRIYGRDGTLRYDSSVRNGQPLDAATIARIVTPLLREQDATIR